MDLRTCRKLAIVEDEQLFCEWLDPENGIFGVQGLEGYLDCRDLTDLFVKKFRRADFMKEKDEV